MSRTLKEIRLQDRTARARLAPRHHPYWRAISEGCHIGYFRGVRGASWVARYRLPGFKDEYQRITLGGVDDLADANGDTVLSWKQVIAKASEWFAAKASEGRGDPIPLGSDRTVQDALGVYVAMRDARQSERAGRPVKSDAHRLHKYVDEDAIAAIRLADLSEADLRSWQRRVPIKNGKTMGRLANDFKAALNHAFAEYRRALPPDFPLIVKYGLQPDGQATLTQASGVRDNQILTDATVRRIIEVAYQNDADGDLARLVVLLAATGARFSQIARMQVGDVQGGHSRLLIPASRKGRGTDRSHIRVQVGQDVIAALKPVLHSRKPEDRLLEHWRHVQVTPTEWRQTERGPWHSASEMLRGWRKIVEDAGVPGIIPYALRHSSIVRGIRVGLPIRLVAAVHDTSVAMIERHYSRWITDGLDELVARAVVPLVSAQQSVNA